MGGSFVVELADDGVELIEGEALVGGSLVVDVGAVQHLEDVVVVDGVVELLGNPLELIEINHSVLVLIEQSEGLLQTVPGLGLAHPRRNDIDELILTDRLVLLLQTVDQVQHEGVSAVETEFLQHLVDLHGIDGSTFVLVKYLEGIDQLFIVFSG
jgi:hypothetical protein